MRQIVTLYFSKCFLLFLNPETGPLIATNVLLLVRPPGTAVPDGLMFHQWCCFSLGSRISEVPRPIAAKLCHMIAIWRQSRAKVGQLGGPPLKKFGAKNMQNLGRFLQLPTLIANISGKTSDIQILIANFSTSIPPAFQETDLVNFGPLLSRI